MQMMILYTTRFWFHREGNKILVSFVGNDASVEPSNANDEPSNANDEPSNSGFHRDGSKISVLQWGNFGEMMNLFAVPNQQNPFLWGMGVVHSQRHEMNMAELSKEEGLFLEKKGLKGVFSRMRRGTRVYMMRLNR